MDYLTDDINNPIRTVPMTAVPIESLPVAALILDRSSQVIACNSAACELWGHPACTGDEARFLAWEYWYLTDQADAPDQRPGERLASIRRADGSLRDVLVSTVPLDGAGGRSRPAVSYFRDITRQRRTEREAFEATRRVHALLSQTHAFIGLLSPSGVLLDCNELSLEVSGLRRDMVVGRPFAETGWWQVSPQVVAATRAAVALAAAGEPVFDESQFLGRDGERRLVDRAFTPVRDRDGQVCYLVAAGRDVTEQRRTELALRDRERHLKAIIDATPECIKVVDPDGLLVSMNPAGLSMVGAEDADAVLGSPVLDIIAREHRPDWWARHQRVCAGETVAWEFDIVSRDGVRRTMETHAVPLTLADGRTGQLACTRDISERRRTEQALRESEKRLRLALQASGQMLWDWDLASGHIVSDPAHRALFGMPPDSPHIHIGDCLDRIAPDHRPRVQAEIDALLHDGQVIATEFRIVGNDGQEKWIAANAIIDRAEDGTPVRVVGTNRDVTNRKRDEQRQELLMREVDHRAKNLLAVIQSLVRLTLRNDPTQFAQSIERRIAALARAHVLLARNRWEPTSLAQVVGTELAAYQDVGRIDVAGPEILLVPDAVQPLSMMLHELVTNAAKHGALSVPDGAIRMEWQVDGDGVHVSWSETGSPASGDVRNGFGLVLVRATSAQLGGTAVLHWTPEGLRCRFRIDAAQLAGERPAAGSR
ncbi:MAG TPA: PAS domain S-box protein [Azospirillaceae bacterium]|nr:PAS domain S-box protein [Azospirillaceae bacterium]